MKFFLSILMIAAGIGAIVFFVAPQYQGVQELQEEKNQLSTALANARKLEETRKSILEQYNLFSEKERSRLSTMLPSNIDNVKLLIELDSLAAQYGLSLQNINIQDDNEEEENPSAVNQQGSSEYGSIRLNFTIKGPYGQFVSFIEKLERSLRLIDIKQVSFQAGDDSDVYQYNVTVETYWLR